MKELLTRACDLTGWSEEEVLTRALREFIEHRSRNRSLEERFWSKVRKTDGCWLWDGARIKNKYGTFRLDPGATVRAHRMSWELTNGPIHNDLHVLHKCDNPSCVRPDHLFLGTHKENMMDMSKKGRSPRRGIGNPKLTREQVLEVRRRFSGGETKKHIALSLGVHPKTIELLIRGKTWSTLLG